MSTQTEVLYGNRLFDQVTYSTNQDPQTFNATLSDSTSVTDARIVDSINQVLADLIALSDSRIITSGTKPFADLITLTESIAKQVNRSFSDSGMLSDARIVATITKALTDLITLADARVTTSGTKALSEAMTLTDSMIKNLAHVLADSLSSSDSKAFTVTKILPPTPSILASQALFGKMLYASPLYSTIPAFVYGEPISLSDAVIRITATKVLADSLSMADVKSLTAVKVLLESLLMLDLGILFTATKAATDFIILNEWLSITLEKAEIWNFAPVTEPTSQLYGKFLFAGELYSSVPSSTWTNPPESSENFTNLDGEGNVP